MTIVSTTAICLLAVFAFLFGRSAVISNGRLNRYNKVKEERDKLSRCLDSIEDSSKYDRYFYVECYAPQTFDCPEYEPEKGGEYDK